jgi:hypothetical protein
MLGSRMGIHVRIKPRFNWDLGLTPHHQPRLPHEISSILMGVIAVQGLWLDLPKDQYAMYGILDIHRSAAISMKRCKVQYLHLY